MLLAFWIVLLAVSFWILISVYSMFFPFFENLNNMSQYNAAYYAAIASVERWELVLRYKKPWFQWTWWFVGGTKYWSDSDFNSDFWIINDSSNWMWWNITSRTRKIPNPWWWNVDFMLADNDSEDYNMIDYYRWERFILDVDNTTDPDEYYNTSGNIKVFSGAYISWLFRLPPKVFAWFSGMDWGLLCNYEDDSSCDPDWDNLFDEVVLDWSMEGTYNGGSESNDFSITPVWSINVMYSPTKVDFAYDNAIRETHFDDKVALFSTNFHRYSPIESVWWYFRTWHNIIWKDAHLIKDLSFGEILASPDITWLALKFSLLDLLRTRNWNIYPFLEYKFEFSEDVSDRFYHIQWVGKVWDYDIHIQVNKPTSNDSSVWEFAIIF